MRVALLIVLLFISGYSLAGTQDKTTQCLEGLIKDSRFSSLTKHLVLDGQNVTKPQMLTDNKIPNDEQKLAIADWIDARSLCVNLSPTKISVDLHILFLSIVPELYNGQATFGEFNKKWQKLFKEATEVPANPPDTPPATHQH